MDPQTTMETGIQQGGATSPSNPGPPATPGGSEDHRAQNSSAPGSSPGGLSSLSMLINLLDSASTVGTSRKESDSVPPRGRDHGSHGTGQRQRHDGFSSGNFRDDGYRSGGRSGGGTGGGRWKSGGGGGGGGSFTFSEFGRRHQQTSGGIDGLNKSFQVYSERASHQPSELSFRGTGGAGRSAYSRSTLSTPGGPSGSPKTDPTTPSKDRVVSDRGARVTTTPSSGISPASCPTPLSSGNSTPSVKCVDVQSVPVSSGQPSSEAGTGSVSAPSGSSGAPRAQGTWRPSRVLDPRVKLCREMKGLLNKLTVENFPVVGDRVTSLCASVDSVEQLNDLIDLVLDKAFTEPDFSQLYADLCLIMSYTTPSLVDSASTSPAAKSGQSLFSSLIVKKLGDEFNKLPAKLELSEEQKATLSPEDQEILITKMKTRLRGLCVSFGEFLVRRMVGMRGFNLASCVLLAGDNPGEHLVEGMCQMITTAGAYLDSDPVGKVLLENSFGRLQDLQANGVFSKRISCLVQDLVDARKVQWHRKVHKERAKGLSQIKQDAENADLVGGAAVRAQYGFVVQLGQRSNLLDSAEYAKYMQQQEERYRKRLQETS